MSMTEAEQIEFLDQNPEIFARLFPEVAQKMFANTVNKSQSFAGYPNAGSTSQYKHGTVSDLNNQMAGPLNEEAFFVDCSLEAPVINTTLFPVSSILAMLPVRPSVIDNTSHAFITSIDDGEDGLEPDYPCDEPPTISHAIDACKINLPFGRRARQTETGELDELVKKACKGLYDDFYFVGEAGFSQRRGVSDYIPRVMTTDDRDFILASAVRKQLGFLGRNFQKWMMKTIWTGDGSVSSANGGYKEFYGFLNLIRDDYSTSGLPLTAMGGSLATCDALNSCVVDFNDCICSGSKSLYDAMQSSEAEIYARADIMGLLPMSGHIFMPHLQWQELVKCLPCEMIANGCETPGAVGITRQINLGDVNADLEQRNNFLRNQKIMLNSRIYEVVLDSTMPSTETDNLDGTWSYSSPIVFIPFSVAGGEQTVYMEHIDYRRFGEALAPLPHADLGIQGWTDNGRFHMIANVLRRCFNIDVKTEPKLVFTAPFLSWRLDNVMACVEGCRSTWGKLAQMP